jgi:hypothetical protein
MIRRFLDWLFFKRPPEPEGRLFLCVTCHGWARATRAKQTECDPCAFA